MKQPKKPTLPTRPSKPTDPPKQRLITNNHIPHNLNFDGRTTSVSSLIDELTALTKLAKNPDQTMIQFHTSYGYYNEVDRYIYVYEPVEIDNPAHDKQLAAYNNKVAAYERKLQNYDALMKQYHIDVEQYDFDMKAYYDWKVSEKKDKGK